MAGQEGKSSAQEHEEVGKLSVVFQDEQELANKEKAKHQWMLAEEVDYYMGLVLTKVESLLIPEDHASFYTGGVDEIRRINERIRKKDKLTKDMGLNQVS